MTDKLILENYLLILKSTVEVYVHGTLESSNKDSRKILKDNLDSILKSQADTYDEMTKYGWYKIDNVESTKVNETLSKVMNQN